MDYKLLSDDETRVLIGSRIRKRRNELRLSQAKLAKAISVSKSTVCLYEAGSVSIPSERLVQIAAALSEPSIGYFFNGAIRLGTPYKNDYASNRLSNRFLNLEYSHQNAVVALVTCLERGIVHTSFLDYIESLEAIERDERVRRQYTSTESRAVAALLDSKGRSSTVSNEQVEEAK